MNMLKLVLAAAVALTVANTAAQAAVDAPGMPAIAVSTPPRPAAQEVTGDNLQDFVAHHATLHYTVYRMGNLAHWRGGKESICPQTVGLDAAAAAIVTARIRAVASYVGAPLQADPHFRQNVQVLFTADPEAAMNDVVKWASVYFRAEGRYAKRRRLIAFNGDHAIQGWYLTTPGGSPVSNSEVGDLNIHLEPVWPQITPNFRVDDHEMSGIGAVIVVVDTTKAGAYSLRTLADYAAMLTLSVIQSPNHCDALPSILDVMSPTCVNRDKPKAMTAGDLAFLKALYYRNFEYGRSPSRGAIEHSMMQQFERD